MIIDIHTHVHTPEDAARPFWQGRCPMTIENVLEAQKLAGIDVTVVSNPLHDLRHMDRAQQLEAVTAQNRYVAELQDKHDSIYGFATTVPYGGDGSCSSSSARCARTGSRVPGSSRACRASIPTTTRRCRSSSSPASSTCPW
jgi:hypothetical protein